MRLKTSGLLLKVLNPLVTDDRSREQ